MSNLPVIVTIFLVLAAACAAFFIAVVIFYMGILIKDELKIYREEPRLSKAERNDQELAWEMYLLELKTYHFTRPMNVFRDGVNA